MVMVIIIISLLWNSIYNKPKIIILYIYIYLGLSHDSMIFRISQPFTLDLSLSARLRFVLANQKRSAEAPDDSKWTFYDEHVLLLKYILLYIYIIYII